MTKHVSLEDVDCGGLNLENGNVKLTGTKVGDKAFHRCNKGYFLVGVQVRVCRKDGKWSDKPPVCKRKLLFLNYNTIIAFHCFISC